MSAWLGDLAQIVMTYQTVKIERTGRAHMDLVIDHFVDRSQIVPHFKRRRSGIFQGGSESGMSRTT